MTDELEPPKPAEFPVYHAFKISGEGYLGVRKTDTLNSDWHIVSEHGLNYGAWQSVESFRKSRVNALNALLLPDGRMIDKLTAMPIGSVRLSLRHIQ